MCGARGKKEKAGTTQNDNKKWVILVFSFGQLDCKLLQTNDFFQTNLKHKCVMFSSGFSCLDFIVYMAILLYFTALYCIGIKITMKHIANS